ncbi:hypothetical protein [Aquimarina pacifica]|uniref:hypothetical protein n=1 Tax=Aquimarina pacifica TaxID=1296415 RepID=UPI00046F196A|nr:hypothetical protein [Aquimarina pacifica]
MDLLFSTNNNIQALKNGGAGVCAAMTLEWIKKSQQLNGVTRAWQVGSSFQFAIAQGAGMIAGTDDRTFRNSGLMSSSESTSMMDLGKSSISGYQMLSIWNSEETEGHSMGVWIDEKQGKYHFFDPNGGLYEAESSSELLSDINLHLLNWYSDLNGDVLIRNIM